MSGDGLSLTGLADHEKLRQDGHRLQVDGECPQNLGQTKEGGHSVGGEITGRGCLQREFIFTKKRKR